MESHNKSNNTQIPKIEGTYVLKSWKSVKNGKVPPVQKGTLTFDGTRRIFTFAGKDDNGNNYSEMYVAKYTLTNSQYTESPEYLVLDHFNGKKPSSYDFEETPYSSNVEILSDKIKFGLPHPFESTTPVILEIQGQNMKAMIGDEFEYYWERNI